MGRDPVACVRASRRTVAALAIAALVSVPALSAGAQSMSEEMGGARAGRSAGRSSFEPDLDRAGRAQARAARARQPQGEGAATAANPRLADPSVLDPSFRAIANPFSPASLYAALGGNVIDVDFPLRATLLQQNLGRSCFGAFPRTGLAAQCDARTAAMEAAMATPAVRPERAPER
jgi:hypothetical protein